MKEKKTQTLYYYFSLKKGNARPVNPSFTIVNERMRKNLNAKSNVFERKVPSNWKKNRSG